MAWGWIVYVYASMAEEQDSWSQAAAAAAGSWSSA
jgi:hypothetical protein